MDRGVSPLPKTVRWTVLTTALLFLLLGLILLPYPGLQNDECLFAQPLYGPVAPDFMIHKFHRDIPLMLMTYLGTTKTLLFAPIFKVWPPSVWSIRFPGLITGALTIWMFALLLWRVGGSFAAITGAFLLALDPTFILTTVFDWGPVAFQHFFFVAAVLALYDFHKTGSRWKLAAGFLCLGLGMWDKALFSWILSGLVVASLFLLVKEIRNRLTIRNAAIATLAFVLGALPLIVYNVRNQGETFRGNTKMVPAEIWPKTLMVRHTLDGSGLFGYLLREEYDNAPKPPGNSVERASAWLRKVAGYRREGWLPQALLIALACLPLWRPKWKTVLFACITATVAWMLMAATQGAGGSVHHVVLLWPVPHFLVAFCLAAAVAARPKAWRWAAAALVAIVCAQNVLVINQYLYNAQRTGSGLPWTDAIFPLRESLVRLHPDHVNLMDWGAEYNLIALEQGRLDIRWGAEPGDRETPNANDLRLLGIFLEQAPQSVWVEHVEPVEVTTGGSKRFETLAGKQGYRKENLDLIRDRNGRQIFQIYRFVKEGP